MLRRGVNPIRSIDLETDRVGNWCLRVSPGCDHCFAAKIETDFQGHDYTRENRSKIDFDFVQKIIAAPVRQTSPMTCVWQSKSDLFYEEWPDEFINECFGVMALTPQHTHIVETKRPLRAVEYFQSPTPTARIMKIAKHAYRLSIELTEQKRCVITYNELAGDLLARWPMPNVQIGVSVETNKYRNRIDELLAVPAAVRFVAAQPLLEELDLTTYLQISRDGDRFVKRSENAPLVDLVVGAGERGKLARLCRVQWIRSLRDQCQAAGVPFQWHSNGEYCAAQDIPEDTRRDHDIQQKFHRTNVQGVDYFKVGRKFCGNLIDGRSWNESPRVRQ